MNNTIKFNIGSAVNGVDRMITPWQAMAALWEHGFAGPTRVKIERSNTETTYVITVEGYDDSGDYYPSHEAAVYAVCEALQQDAIAYKVIHAPGAYVGYLVGPKAEDWGGEFNDAYFIE